MNPPLGVRATVFMDSETHGPTCAPIKGEGLREISPSEDVDIFYGPLVDELDIVSPYSLHVALYALQQGTPEAIERALTMLGTSGDLEDHTDDDTLLPLPVEAPHGWSL